MTAKCYVWLEIKSWIRKAKRWPLAFTKLIKRHHAFKVILFFNFLFCIGVYPVNNAVIVSVSLVAQSYLIFVTPWTAACQSSLSITNSWSLPKLIPITSVMPSNHLIICRPLLFLPSIFPSIRVFSNESVLRIRWPKYWSFSIHPSNEYSELIFFRMDWLDLLAVQGTLKSLL